MGICLVSKYSRCRKARLPVEASAFGIIGGASGATVRGAFPISARIYNDILFIF